MVMRTGALKGKTVEPARTKFQHFFISEKNKATSDVFVIFVIQNLVTPFETHWFSVSSLPAMVAIYECTIWDLGISRSCSLLNGLWNSKSKL
jgi:hypothetical protein